MPITIGRIKNLIDASTRFHNICQDIAALGKPNMLAWSEVSEGEYITMRSWIEDCYSILRRDPEGQYEARTHIFAESTLFKSNYSVNMRQRRYRARKRRSDGVFTEGSNQPRIPTLRETDFQAMTLGEDLPKLEPARLSPEDFHSSVFKNMSEQQRIELVAITLKRGGISALKPYERPYLELAQAHIPHIGKLPEQPQTPKASTRQTRAESEPMLVSNITERMEKKEAAKREWDKLHPPGNYDIDDFAMPTENPNPDEE
jgi:hypothetical protein